MEQKISVVIPCYNAEKNIESVIETDIDTFKNYGINDFEFILVNDCSRDNTWNVLCGLSHKHNNIVCVNLAKNCGQHGAIMAGFHYVSGDYVVVSDDDGQTQMKKIGEMCQKMEEGYDVVMTEWVERKGRSFFRKIGTRVNDMVSAVLLDNPQHIPLSIFFMAKRFVIDEIIQYKNPYPYIVGLVLRTTHNIGVVQVEQLSRQNGKSGYTIKKLLGLWLNGLTAFSVLPLRIAYCVGGVSAMVGFVCGIIIVIKKLVYDYYMAGWSSTVAIMLFMFGITLCVLGVIGEYLGRIYICINNAPQYVVKEIIDKNDREL